MTAHKTFGQYLRDARERRGLSIEQLSTQTTIPVPDIEAFEAGLIDALPRAMYRRAEARAYAEAVGLDPDVILTQLRRVGEPAPARDLPASPVAPIPPVPPAPTDVPRPPSTPSGVSTVPEKAHAAVRMPTTSLKAAAPPQASDKIRATRAIIALIVGCAGLMWEGQRLPTLQMTAVGAPIAVREVTPVAVIEEAVRIAEPPAPAPSMRRVLYEPRSAAKRTQSAREGRLDEGVLVVHSSPRGARVTVNGVGWGVTPVAIRYLPLGTMRVRVGKTNFGVQERVVQLTPEQPSTTLRVTLPPDRRAENATTSVAGDMLVITSVPEGARVTVNGIGWGTTPVSIRHVPAGTQHVRIVKDQFRSEERVVTVHDGEPRRLSVTLKPTS